MAPLTAKASPRLSARPTPLRRLVLANAFDSSSLSVRPRAGISAGRYHPDWMGVFHQKND